MWPKRSTFGEHVTTGCRMPQGRTRPTHYRRLLITLRKGVCYRPPSQLISRRVEAGGGVPVASYRESACAFRTFTLSRSLAAATGRAVGCYSIERLAASIAFLRSACSGGTERMARVAVYPAGIRSGDPVAVHDPLRPSLAYDFRDTARLVIGFAIHFVLHPSLIFAMRA